MKKSTVILGLGALLIAELCSSCSDSIDNKVEYLPFQETSDGQWGMISMDGKVLFSEEFKTKPTIVRDGRFFVRTKEGVWEMYDATEKPKKIGVDYAHTSGFYNGTALVAEKGKPVSLIDKEGKTVKLLDKIEGKTVDGVRSFQRGYAVFMTKDSLFGVIDTKGNCVVKPEYYSLNNCGDNKFIGANVKYKDFVKKNNKDKVKISVINTDGKVILDIMSSKYENIGGVFSNGLLPVSVKKDAMEMWGLINDKGETVVKPSVKIKSIGTVSGDKFTYNNGEGWGLMNTKGETLIRAKYEMLYQDIDNVLIAVVKEGESYVYKYVDQNDKKIGDETFIQATLFSMYDGEHALVKPNDKIYSIIDKSGKVVEGLPDIVDISTFEGEGYVESDFIDIAKMLDEFKISENGIIGVSFKTTPQEAVKMSVNLGFGYGTDAHPAGTAYWYDYRNDIDIYKDVDGVRGFVTIKYPGKLSKQTYSTRRVIDFTYGDWYYYHNERTPLGYVWNSYNPNILTFKINNYGRMHGKLRDLYKHLYGKFKKWGTVTKENNSAAVIELNNGHRALVAMEKDNVFVSWGDLIPAKEIDIESYKDATEEDNLSMISYGYLSELFPNKVDEVVDTVAVDTVVVDY